MVNRNTGAFCPVCKVTTVHVVVPMSKVLKPTVACRHCGNRQEVTPK